MRPGGSAAGAAGPTLARAPSPKPGVRDPRGPPRGPGCGVAEDELAAMLGRPAALGVGQAELLAGGCRTPRHSIRTKPAEDLDQRVASCGQTRVQLRPEV